MLVSGSITSTVVLGQDGRIEDDRQLTLPLETPPAEEPIDAARERLRALAKDKGVLWLRPILEKAGVRRLGDLPEACVRELLQSA